MLRNRIKAAFTYTGIFAAIIVVLEISLRFIMEGELHLRQLPFLMFVPAEAVALSMLSGFGKSTLNKVLLPIVTFILSFFYIAQAVYYKNFGSLFSISMVGMGGTALGNFGWALKDTLINSIGSILILLIPFVLVLSEVLFGKIKFEKTGWQVRLCSLFVGAALWIGAVCCLPLLGTGRQSAYFAYHNSLSDTDTTADRIGALTTSSVEVASYYFGITNDIEPISYTSVDTTILGEEIPTEKEIKPQIDERFDFATVGANADDEEIKALCTYFEQKSPTYTNEYTGMFEGYNLIYICAESFWSYAVNEQVTPTLYRMANEGIVLTNYYNSFKNTTTNGEYAFVTSLWPDVSRVADTGVDVGSFPQSSSKYMPLGIGKMFNSVGANAYGFHNYYGKYYRRNLSWPNLGLNCKFMDEGMTFTSSWPASDIELMEQSVDDYIDDPQFLAYYMTFSGHGPYTNSNVMYNKNVNEVKALLPDSDLDDQAYGYLAGELELDKALSYLLERLEEKGILDKTVIVIAGDHYPYNLSEAGRDSLAGHSVDPSIERYKSTCIIYNAGMEEPIVDDTYCCNVDIYPTMLNLFGIPYDSRLFAGRDIFAGGVHRAMLYNKSFISDLVTYNNETGVASWTEKSESMTDEEKNNYLNTMISLNETEYAVSVKMMSKNFYYYLWRNSALMMQEEIDAENAREAAILEQAANMNAAEAAQQAAKQEAEQPLDEEGNPITNVDEQPQTSPEVVPAAPAEAPATEVTPAQTTDTP